MSANVAAKSFGSSSHASVTPSRAAASLGGVAPVRRDAAGICAPPNGSRNDPDHRGANAGPDAALREVCAALQLGPEQHLSTDRLLELVPHLLRLALVLDTVAWGVWRQKMAPAAGSSMRQNTPLQRVIKDAIAPSDSHAGPPGPSVVGEIDRLRELVRAMLSGVAQCGTEVASRVKQGISPSEIEASVGTAGLRNRDAEYWREYKCRAESLDSAALDREVTGVIARFVDKWMRNAAAKPRAS